MKRHNDFLPFVALTCCLVLWLCSGPSAASGPDESVPRLGQENSVQAITGLKLAAADENRAKKYHWLLGNEPRRNRFEKLKALLCWRNWTGKSNLPVRFTFQEKLTMES